MSKNNTLTKAKNAKKDEFYTQSSDIQAELKHYKKHFKDKIVFCNCDDPFESNFFKYFALNFEHLGLKKLISTCYDGSPIAGTQLSIPETNKGDTENGKVAYKAIINAVYDADDDGCVDMYDVKKLFEMGKNSIEKLDGNGDFRSEECIELLKQSDIVVTNPPFSLFREYVAQLIEYNKKFIIIGNINAVTYKEIFPLIKDNKMWIGASIHSGDRAFNVPDDYPLKAAGCGIDNDGRKYIRVKGVRWYTNLEIKYRHQPLILYKHYNEEDNPKYDNYDAIEVSKTADIPEDYDGVMGVPITFLDKYCPEQFEIVNANDYRDSEKVKEKPYGLIKDKDGTITHTHTHQEQSMQEFVSDIELLAPGADGWHINGKRKYARIFIRRL